MLSLNLPPCYHISLPHIMGFYIKIIHQRIQTTRLHTPRCHRYFCNVDFVLFHNVTHYTNSLLSHFHVNTTDLFNNICTLVAAGEVLGRLECMLTNTQA